MGKRTRTFISAFGERHSTIELCPHLPVFPGCQHSFYVLMSYAVTRSSHRRLAATPIHLLGCERHPFREVGASGGAYGNRTRSTTVTGWRRSRQTQAPFAQKDVGCGNIPPLTPKP